MPVKKCMIKGKSGWKWGDKGKCYTGKNGKIKAAKQGIAVANSGSYNVPKKELDKLYGIISKGK